MGTQLSLSVIEIIILMLGAIVLGFTICFVVYSRRAWKEMKESIENRRNPSYSAPAANRNLSDELTSWKSKFFEETDLKNKLVDDLKRKLTETEEELEIYTIEAEEAKAQNKKLKAELEQHKSNPPQTAQGEYISEIKKAEQSLLAQNERIAKLLGQLDVIKASDSKSSEITIENEELKNKLAAKEKEVQGLRQKENLTREMASMLDNAYEEFGILQEKIKTLEQQLAASKANSIQQTDLEDGNVKLSRDNEELKQKYHNTLNEVQELRSQLSISEEKYADAEFHRKQLEKKISYLENINADMQLIADSHKKLETQIKRMGELESMINIMSEEKDRLALQKLKSV